MYVNHGPREQEANSESCEIHAAVHLVLSGEVATHAMPECTKAVLETISA